MLGGGGQEVILEIAGVILGGCTSIEVMPPTLWWALQRNCMGEKEKAAEVKWQVG